MKKIILIAFAIISIIAGASFSSPESIYNITFNDIDRNAVSMKQFRGKKLLIITVPVTRTDTSVLNQLAEFQKKYKESVSVIGILSVEDGYKVESKTAIKGLYQETLNLNLILGEGMHTRKSHSKTQSPLMAWLTQKNQNTHFNNDVSGIGQKFFIDEDGDLYAVIGSEITLSHSLIDRIVNRSRRDKPLSDPDIPQINNEESSQ